MIKTYIQVIQRVVWRKAHDRYSRNTRTVKRAFSQSGISPQQASILSVAHTFFVVSLYRFSNFSRGLQRRVDKFSSASKLSFTLSYRFRTRRTDTAPSSSSRGMPFVTDFDVTYGNALAPAVRHVHNFLAFPRRNWSRPWCQVQQHPASQQSPAMRCSVLSLGRCCGRDLVLDHPLLINIADDCLCISLL